MNNTTPEHIQEILQIVRKQAITMFADKLKSVILYGSCARGDYDSESDIDIMVLVDMDKYDLIPYRKDIAHLSSEIDLEYDVFTSIKLQDFQTYQEWLHVVPFYQNVQREGIVVNG